MMQKILTIAIVAVLLISFGCKKAEKPAPPQAAPEAPAAQQAEPNTDCKITIKEKQKRAGYVRPGADSSPALFGRAD